MAILLYENLFPPKKTSEKRSSNIGKKKDHLLGTTNYRGSSRSHSVLVGKKIQEILIVEIFKLDCD